MRYQQGNSLSTLLSLLLLYAILLSTLILFSDRIFTLILRPETNMGLFILLAGVAFSLALSILAGIQLVRLYKEHKQKSAGSGLKIRLTGFFIAVTLVSSIPPGFLAISFINTNLNQLTNSNIDSALTTAEDMALNYYKEKTDYLEQMHQNPVFDTLLKRMPSAPAASWSTLKRFFPDISIFQFIDSNNKVIYESGDSAYLSRIDLELPQGVTTISYKDSQILISNKKSTLSGRQYSYRAGIVLPRYFNSSIQNITKGLADFKSIQENSAHLPVISVTFYGLMAMPMLLISILIALSLSGTLLLPIIHIEEATKKIAAGDFSARLLSKSNSSLPFLVNSFNEMVNELATTRNKIIQTEKVEAWKEIAQRLAHEIKNPLTPIKLNAERILRKYRKDPESVTDILETGLQNIIKEVDALTHLINEFRDLSKIPEPKLESISLKEIFDDLRKSYESDSIHIHIEDTSYNVIKGDPVQMRQVFSNLIKNACEAMTKGGTITIRSDLINKRNTSYYRITIEDTGIGMDADTRNRIFNPYFTSKKHGTGLGLSIVERIILDHRGIIWLESAPGEGTRFFIDLPVEV